nr:hypothetical protein Q903MT_gene243 [Picea sitchensis]
MLIAWHVMFMFMRVMGVGGFTPGKGVWGSEDMWIRRTIRYLIEQCSYYLPKPHSAHAIRTGFCYLGQ